MNTVDKELYKKMPEELAEFVQTEAKTDYLVEENGRIINDVWYKDYFSCATIYVEEHQPLTIRMDYVVSVDTLTDNYFLNAKKKLSVEEIGILKTSLQAGHNQLVEFVKGKGYNFYPSHESGDGVTEYWDVVINGSEWDKETFTAIWDKLEKQVQDINKALEKAGF